MVDDRDESINKTAQVDTIRIFFDEIDFSPDAGYGVDGWLALSYCAIFSSIDNSVFDWLIHVSIPAMEANFEVAGFVDLVNRLLDHDLPSLWPMIPNKTNQMIRALDHCRALTGWLVVHQSIAAFRSTRYYNAAELLARGVSPHSTCQLSLVRKGLTPTALAVLSSAMFCRWRANLLLAGIKMEDLIEREVNNGSIHDQGWSRASLLHLFERSLAPSSGFSNDRCTRCAVVIDERSPTYEVPEFAIQVEVGWCLELEGIKRCENGPVNDTDSSKALHKRSHEARGIFCPCVQTYDFVCLLCWEALHSHDHNHARISRSETAPEVEILLDEEDEPFEWEDSMFLLSI